MSYYPFFQEYLDFTSGVQENGFTSCRCPFHDDTHPSAGVDIEKGVFYCHACALSLSAARFLAKIEDLTYQEATTLIDALKRSQNMYSNEANWSSVPVPYRRKFHDLSEESLQSDIASKAIVQDYAESRGLILETLKATNIGWLPAHKTHWKRESIVVTYTGPYGICAIRYRDQDGNKGGEPGSWMTLWGLDSLEDYEEAVVIVEGESDRLRLLQELKELEVGIKVVSTPGVSIKKEWLRDLANISTCIHMPQADDASTKAIQGLQNLLKDRYKILRLPWKRGQVGKDFCDWMVYNEGNSSDMIRTLQGMAREGNRRIIYSGAEFERIVEEDEEPVLISNLWKTNQFMIIGGQQKHKKTYLVLNLMRTLLTGGSFLGIPEFQAEVNPEDITFVFVEEEGDKHDLKQRAQKILGGTPWQEQTWWIHRSGIKISEDADILWLIAELEKLNTRKYMVLVADPFQMLHNLDEDKASDMRAVYENINTILYRFPNLSIAILYHFGKAGKIEDTWNALRGSSRAGGSADVGLFIDKVSDKELRLKIDGRTFKPVEAPDGSDIFTLVFHDEECLIQLKGISQKAKDLFPTIVEVVDQMFNSPTVSFVKISEIALRAKTAQKLVKMAIKTVPDKYRLDGALIYEI